MKVQLATILIGLCGAALAAPTHVQQEKRLWPFHFPGQGREPGAEPSLPLPCYPFPTESDDPTGSDFPRFFPRPPFGERCGESPLGSLTDGEDSSLGSISSDGEGLPWQLSGEDEQDSESQGLMGGEELGVEENDIGGDDNEI
ncbi:hypothetical protein BDW60DRAFT_65693 [Aspergillus nidulans var. acristatus]|jgi:hypothetical protein